MGEKTLFSFLIILDMKLTFIVPLYNDEEFLSICLDSILKTDLDKSDYEVIVINDGSVDGGPAIAEDYAKRYDNFRVYHQENQGLSVARNHGLREAKGDYIWFVDSDDYVDATKISPILQMLDERRIQVCKFDSIAYKENGETEISRFSKLEANTVYTGEEVLLGKTIMGAVWNSFYNRRFLVDNDLWFYPGIYHQDSEFSIRCATVTARQLFLHIPLYIYRYNTNSSTRSKSYERVLKSYISDVIIAHNIRTFTSKNNTLSKELRDFLSNYPTSIMKGRLLMLLLHKEKYAMRLFDEVVSKSKELDEYPLKLEKRSLKNLLVISLINNKYLFKMLVRLRNVL